MRYGVIALGQGALTMGDVLGVCGCGKFEERSRTSAGYWEFVDVVSLRRELKIEYGDQTSGPE